MRAHWTFLGVLVMASVLCCYGDGGVGIEISVGNGEVDISLPGLHNPCDDKSCPGSQECTVVYHPGFMDIPVAHCIPTHAQTPTQKGDPTSCVEFRLGSNVMHCKTEEEWRNVGLTQCTLRGGSSAPQLSDIQVAYACHSFEGSSKAVFLQAHFTCCPILPDTPSQDEEIGHQEQVQTQVFDDSNDYEHNRIVLYPVLIAMAVVVAIIIVVVAVWHRRRSKRKLRHPKLIIATSFVNPSADHEDTPTYDIWDEYSGRSDKSVLVINDHTQYTPSN